MEVSPKEYYTHLFPYDKLVHLLTCNGDDLANTEFAIEGLSPGEDKFYRRYVSVKTAKELKAEVANFPYVKTFHFGAVYTGKPSSSARVSIPVRRVLSFDIDLTDKEWIPLKEKGDVSLPLCDRAWPVCAASVDLLKRILKLAFGYTQVLVVYSGRRGAHVHVFDEGAMSLSSEGRAAIIGYVNGTTGTDKLRSTSGVHLVMKMHNLRKHVYRLFERWFVRHMGILDSLDNRNTFLNRLDLYKYDSLTDVMDMLVGDVMDKERAIDAWECIVQKLEGVRDRVPWVLDRLDCAVLAYVWPVLDTNVTRDIAHLTKVPFACHAKTGRVACAVNVDLPASFQPNEQAPSLVSWNQDNMDEALSHFHNIGVSDHVAEERHRALQESGTVPSTHAITGQVMSDVEDLVDAPPPPPPPRSKSTLPRKMAFKRKKSPLIPEGEELAPF
jgi:predicted DNA primase small subunit